MEANLKAAFTLLGKMYEAHIWEQGRRRNVAAQRDLLKLGYEADEEGDARLTRKIQILETILNLIAKYNEI